MGQTTDGTRNRKTASCIRKVCIQKADETTEGIAEKISSRNPVIENYIYSEMIKNIEISEKEYTTNSNNIDS